MTYGRHDSLFTILNIFIILGFLLQLSCEESLPPYNDPTNLFSGEIEAVYILSADENHARVVLRVRNIYDETLDGTAKIEGEIKISSERNPAIAKTIPITPSMFASGRYDSRTGRLVIDPKEIIRFETIWDLTDDLGRHVRSTLLVMVSDTTCPAYRCFALPEEFRLTATIKLYERIALTAVGPSIFRLCYIPRVVGPPLCPPPPLLPCDQRTLTLGPCTVP